MKKISTLFIKNPNDLGKVVNEINPDNQWVFDGLAIPTRKFDGTSCAIIEGELYKRFDLKEGKKLPPYTIPCQKPDENSGHHPHWVKCDPNDPSNKWHFEAFNKLIEKINGTYELCGEKIQGNSENIIGYQLIKHGEEILNITDFTYNNLYHFLLNEDIEGIVFHHKNENKMCKIRKSDFGIKRK